MAEDFARNDPYVVHGLVARWEVRPWTVVIGNDTLAHLGTLGVITRLWSARTTEPQSHAYLRHFSEGVLPKLRGLGGYAGATVLTRRLDGNVEILVATRWRSMSAIDEFAGPDREAAVVADEAAALLTEFDSGVRHFEVALADTPVRDVRLRS